ncbi:hypothetical protein GCM10027578_43990 [Spirosoma luteolum]
MMPTQPQQTDNLNRAAFIKSLGLSGAALMAFYCMGTLSACSSKSTDPAPSTGTGTGTGTGSNTLDLTSAANSALKTEGGYIYNGNMIVARIKGGSYVALARACTHQGTNVQYRLTQNDFFCPNHGSEFSTTGAVEVGPATAGLTVYKTALSADGNTLTISA